MKKAQIREIFLQAGFTIKEGQSDLKPYVYEAAADLLRARDEEEASQPARDRLKDAMGAYLRVCSSGGMPSDTRDKVASAFAEALTLGYFDEILNQSDLYRWLRAQHWDTADLFVVAGSKSQIRLGTDCPSHDRLDELIRAAMAAEQPAQKGMKGCGKCDDDPAECAWHQQCLAPERNHSVFTAGDGSPADQEAKDMGIGPYAK